MCTYAYRWQIKSLIILPKDTPLLHSSSSLQGITASICTVNNVVCIPHLMVCYMIVWDANHSNHCVVSE